MENHINNFTFYNPVRIEFGENKIKELPNLIPKEDKILVIYGSGSAKESGTFEKVLKALEGYSVGEFGGIEANPCFETCMKAVDKIREEHYDFLLAVGGGSVIDASKFIAAAAKFEGNPVNIFSNGIGTGEEIKRALPLGTVLTLPATGSEMNDTSVISFKDQQAKVSVKNWKLYPVFSILDPTLTYTLPKRQLANGITDAFVHTIEQYLTYSVNAKIPDRFSEGVLKTLIEIAPDVVDEENHDYSARANYMWAATVALNRWLSTGVPQDWASHALGHEITVFNNTDHARSLSAVLPALMYVRRKEKFEKLVQYGRSVWDLSGSDENEIVKESIRKTIQFFKSINMPVSLKEVGVDEENINQLLNQLKAHGQTELSEHGDQTLEVSRKVYLQALNELNF